MKNLEREDYRGCRIELIYDEHPESPREWDNVGTMVCWHRRYRLGDRAPSAASPSAWMRGEVRPTTWTSEAVRREQAVRDSYAKLFDSEDDDEVRLTLQEDLDRELDGVESKMEDDEELCRELFEKDHYVLPLYLYDHSGLSISTGAFSCAWDSGQVGLVYVSKAKAAKEWPKLSGDALRDAALKCMESEVKTYDAYLRGQVVGYVALDPEGEQIDSCWGFYPEERDAEHPEDGEYHYPLNLAREAIDLWVERQEIEATERAHWEARDVETLNPPAK